MHALPLLVALAACSAPSAEPPAVTLSPASGPSSGGYTVEVAWDGATPTDVTLGGVVAWVVEERDDAFTIEVQGAPGPGPAALRFTADGEQVEVADAFSYAPPLDPAFDRMIGFGASIGAGVQSGGITATMAKQSSIAVLAGLAGAYLGLPQVAEGFFPPLSPDTVGQGCDLPSYDEHATDAFLDAIEAMRDDDGDIDWARGRRDAAVEVRNLGIPGAGLAEQAWGPSGGDVGGLFFAHLFHEPRGELTDPLERAQLEHAVDLAPTLVVGVDLLGNDIVDALLDAGGVAPELMQPLDDTRPALREIVAGLAGTGAWVFLADLPRPSALPLATDAAARSRAAGVSEDEIAAMLDEVDAQAAAYSAALAEEAANYENVVVVPLTATVETLTEDGVEVDGTVLTTRALGGLVGLDGIHFTATGNAVLANVLADTIDATLGTSLPRADLGAVLAVDPASPAALAAAGLDPGACP